MWHHLAILIGGYSFIVMTYCSIWVIGSIMAQHDENGRLKRLDKADAKAVLGMMGVWTICWAVIIVIELARGA